MIDYIIDMLMQLAVMLPPFAVIWYFAIRYLKKKGIGVPKAHTLWVFLFFCYLVVLFGITGTLKLSDILGGRLAPDPASINLVPFQDVTILGFGLNIFIFVPIGIITPLIFNGYSRFTKTLAAGFFLSLTIEISQLFKNRVSDIDDLIANTLGAILGWLLFRLIIRTPSQKMQLSKGAPFVQHEGLIIFILAFIIVFLLYPLYIKIIELLYLT